MTIALILIHTLISIVAIVYGVPALRDLFQSRLSSQSITVFLVLAALTSASGFLLPYKTVTPAVAVSIIALIILGGTWFAQTRARTSGLFRLAFVGGMVASEYLLVFVLVAQAFLKVPPLHTLAPTGSEPPFAIAQVIVLVAFIVLGVFVARAFRPQAVAFAPGR